MGARQSKRSVDITTTPKKDGLPAEGSVAGDAAAPGDGKLERIEETDGKPTTNGTGPHADVVIDDKDKDTEQEKEKEKENIKDKDEDNEKEDVKVEDTRPESNTEAPAEAEEVTTPTDDATPTSPDSATSPDSKDAKKKDKKKKWSFRSLSFGKRDRSKTAREDAPKNGDITKEEPVPEGGEEAEVAVPVEEQCPAAEEKTAESSPTVESTPETPAPVCKEEEKTTDAAPASPTVTPVEEKKVEPPTTPAPTPVPVEEKKEEIEKVEPVPVVAEKVEVSPVQANQVSYPVGVTQAQPIATPSIIERKTSEDLPPPLPSSPPPTPIDPSPLQQAQHTAANASALAEALKVPAEAASMASQIAKEPIDVAQSLDESKTNVISDSDIIIELKSKTYESNSPPVNTQVLVAEVQDGVKNIEAPQIISQSLKDSEIVDDQQVAKPVESLPEFENSANSVENKIVEIESKEIIENGVSSEQDSASLENIVSLTNGSSSTETTIIESFIKKEGNNLFKRGGDLVIDSEEGPLPLSEESLVEAKPAFGIPEDNVVHSISQKDSKTENLEIMEMKSSEITSVNGNNHIENESIISTKIESVEEVVPPPLPESPIPSIEKLQEIGELLSENIENLSINSSKTNDIMSEHINSEIVFDPIEELRACHMSAEGILNPAKDDLQELSSSVTDVLNISASSPVVENLSNFKTNNELPEFPSSQLGPAKDVSNLLDDLPVPPNEIYTSNDDILICPLPTKDLPNPTKDNIISDPILKNNIDDIESVIKNGDHSPVDEISIDPLSPKLIMNETPVSSSCEINSSPDNSSISIKKESSYSELLQLIDDHSNQEFEVESLSQSLNSYNNSDVQLKERLAVSEEIINGVDNSTSCPLLKAVPTIAVPDNAQQIVAEPEEEAAAPVENPAEISTTESVNEVQDCHEAPPSVPAPVPILPPSEPAITEDVASVTKAIEENDISDKAVAAAVNEAIESANTNEIVNDSHHQNVINE